jgi:hypothetical protein
VTAEAKAPAAGAAPVGTARVLSDSPEPDSARSREEAPRAAAAPGARHAAKPVPSGPAPADRNRVDADSAAAKAQGKQQPSKLPTKEQNLGVVHGRRRPNKPNAG